jgi:hypothetical protein
MSNFDYNQNHLDSTFEMELVIVGDDEHGLPVLEVNMYPVRVMGMDTRHLVGSLCIPLEDTGLSVQDVEVLPLRDGWVTVTASEGLGIAAEELEELFGPHVAVLALQVLTEALLSEYINMDLRAAPYRSTEVESDELHWAVQALHADLAVRISQKAERQQTRNAFDEIISRSFGR